RRIVNHDARQQRRKIAIAFGQCWHSEIAWLRENVLQLLEGKEKEAAVLSTPIRLSADAKTRKHNRTADSEAVAVVVQRITIRLTIVVFVARRSGRQICAVEKEVIGREHIVAHKFIDRAMVLIGAALERHVDGCSGSMRLLPVITGRLDFELLC